jgi:hypothetical protein
MISITKLLCDSIILGDNLSYVEGAALENQYDEITHNYLREDVYNMWFTVITDSYECLNTIL